MSPPSPSSNRTCGFPASGFLEVSRLGHSQRGAVWPFSQLTSQKGAFDSVVGQSPIGTHSLLCKRDFNSVPWLDWHYPASSLLWTHPTPTKARVKLCLPSPCWYHPPLWVSQVPDGSVCARCPLSPRQVRWLHRLVAYPSTAGFAPSGGLASLQGRVTRPNRVHLRYGSHICAVGLRRADYSARRPLCYLLNEQFTG